MKTRKIYLVYTEEKDIVYASVRKDYAEGFARCYDYIDQYDEPMVKELDLDIDE